MVNGIPHVFLANFSGLKNDEVVHQTPQEHIEIHFNGVKEGGRVMYIPFLGKEQELPAQFNNGQIICSLPTMEKGGIVWLEE